MTATTVTEMEAFEIFKSMPVEFARDWFDLNKTLVQSWISFDNIKICPNFWQVPLPRELILQCTRLDIPNQICTENWCEEVAIEFVLSSRFHLIPARLLSVRVHAILGLYSNFFDWIMVVDRSKFADIINRIILIHIGSDVHYAADFIYKAIGHKIDIELGNDSNLEYVPILWELMKKFQPNLDLGDKSSLINFIQTNFENIDLIVLANVFVRFWPDCFSVVVKAKKLYSRKFFRKLGQLCMTLGFQVIRNWDQICLKQCQTMPWRDVANGLIEGWFGLAAVSCDMMKSKTVRTLVIVRSAPRVMTPELSDSVWFWKHYFLIYPGDYQYFLRFASPRVRRHYKCEGIRLIAKGKNKKRIN